MDTESALWQRFAKRLNDLDEPDASASIAGSAMATDPTSSLRTTHESM
jgi:hypothetical protein